MPISPDGKILLVEDAAVMRKMEGKTLNSLGFENIIEAKDGDEAIAILESNPDIELVISDWNMPNRNGLELLQWVRSNSQFTELPFIMATGRGEKSEVSQASEAGVSAFITKPFDANELQEKIDIASGDAVEEEKVVDRGPRLTADGKVRLKIGHIQITDHLVLGVLKHLIMRGEIQPKTFELETDCMPGWNPVANSLEEGSIDGACVLAPIAMDLFAYGVPLQLILFAHKNGSIFVRNKQGGDYEREMKEFFKERSFYIPHNLSVHNMLAHMFFTNIGLQPGVSGEPNVDVSFEVVPPIKMPEFLSTNDESCGYLVAEPLGTKAIATGIADQQFLSSEMWENHPCCVVTMQQDFINAYPEVVYEFTKLLVECGKYIDEKPGLAAEIAVDFLDPDKSLGLKVPLLKNVLTEPLGIRTNDLYPVIDDLDRMQHYMSEKMGIGRLVNLDAFVDLRFANEACTDRALSGQSSILHENDDQAIQILQRSTTKRVKKTAKELINKEGLYLSFSLGEQLFGVDILKIKELIGLMPIRPIPHAPSYVKGVINLRHKVIPVIDLRLRFGMEEKDYHERTVIIVLEIETENGNILMGTIVDSVSEVADIKVGDLEEAPKFGLATNTKYILAMAKAKGGVQILLDIDRVLAEKEVEMMGAMFRD